MNFSPFYFFKFLTESFKKNVKTNLIRKRISQFTQTIILLSTKITL